MIFFLSFSTNTLGIMHVWNILSELQAVSFREGILTQKGPSLNQKLKGRPMRKQIPLKQSAQIRNNL